MPSKWIKLTLIDKKPIYVDMAHATTVMADRSGSKISFVGDSEGDAQVEESLEKIMAMVESGSISQA